MINFVIKRCLSAIPTLFILITLSFFLMRFAPGNPFSSERQLSPEVLANINAKYGLDKPVFEQYVTYLKALLRGDLGPSFKYKDYTVNELVKTAFPVSAKLGVIAFVLAVFFGVLIGTLAAVKQNTWFDYLIMSSSMFGIVVPSFVLAPLLVLLFSVYLRWLPAGGWQGGELNYMILPVCGLTFLYIASVARLMRGSVIEVLHSDFIRTAKAKGLPFFYIVSKHVMKPALLPVVSYLGPAFVGIITGSVVIETIFGLPGIGQLYVNGALNRDYSMVLGLTIVIGTLTILFNTVVDILYAFLDPKIRY